MIRFIKNNFGNTESTIGASFFCKDVKSSKTEETFKVGIWDTGGDEVSIFYR
jgi:GTPase SAR1 family protein